MKKVIETGAQRVRTRTNIEHVLLRTIMVAGVLSVALLAPNAMRILAMFDGGKQRSTNPKYLFGTAFERLLGKKWISIEQKANGKFVRLTEVGKERLALMTARKPDSRKIRRWDGRWRIVTYDIKEKRKVLRMKLAGQLSDFGFYRLQNSLWVYPYDTEALHILLKAHYKLGSEVLYGVMEKIENDKRLRAHFKLK